MKTNEEQTNEEQIKNQKIVLTLLSQQYGLTVEDVMERYNISREDVIVEK